MFYFIYLLIDFLPLTPRGCATALAEEYVPNLSHSAFGFKYHDFFSFSHDVELCEIFGG